MIHCIDCREAFDERAAIREFDGGMSREEAERAPVQLCPTCKERIFEVMRGMVDRVRLTEPRKFSTGPPDYPYPQQGYLAAPIGVRPWTI